MKQEYARVVDRALIDYMVVSRHVLQRLVDVMVLRREGGGISDYLLVEIKVRVGSQVISRKAGEEKKGFESEQIEQEREKLQYQEEEWKLLLKMQ